MLINLSAVCPDGSKDRDGTFSRGKGWLSIYPLRSRNLTSLSNYLNTPEGMELLEGKRTAIIIHSQEKNGQLD